MHLVHGLSVWFENDNTGMEELGHQRKVVFVQLVSDIHLRSYAGVFVWGGGGAAPSLRDTYRL